MNQCSILPLETIACDRHKKDGTCCLVTDNSPAPRESRCPVSDALSRRVQHRTVDHLLRSEPLRQVHNVQYYICPDPECEVVYFSNVSVPRFVAEDVKVKVLQKDRGDDVNVCYCFEWTRSRIKDEIRRTGSSTASTQIAREIKAGKCACDVKNPVGECCLGDVNAFVKSASDNLTST